MALQMFACTATQTCVVKYLPGLSIISARENRPIGGREVFLEEDRLRAESREYTVHSRRLGPYFCSLYFFLSRRWRGIDRVEAVSPTRSFDRSRRSIDEPRGVWI